MPFLPCSSAPSWTWCWALSTTSWVSWTVSPSFVASFNQHLLAPDLDPALGRDRGHSNVWEEGPVWCTLCCASDARGEGRPGPSSCPWTPHPPPQAPEGGASCLDPQALRLWMVLGRWVSSPQAACGLGEALPSSLISKIRELVSSPRETGVTITRLGSDRCCGDCPGLQIQAVTLTLDPGFQSKHS